MTSLNKKGPVYKQKSHGIEVAVWRREGENGQAFYSVSATRSYKKDDKWHTSSSFNLEDKDLLMGFLNRAFDHAQACLDADREKRAKEDIAA